MGVYIFDFDGTLGNSMPSFVCMDGFAEKNIILRTRQRL